MKVRMQTNKLGKALSLPQVFKNTIKTEGIRAFYKGFCPPLAVGPAINAVVFMTFEFSRRFCGVQNTDDYTFKQIIFCGGMAGLAESFMCTPVDLVKSRLQIQKESKANAYYKGPIDLVRKVIRDEGFKGLYKG
jgi:solute carrier family 25 (mitochondrial carnitine/acylcarnitine transporter), member 20/29